MAFKQSKQLFIDFDIWIEKGAFIKWIISYFKHEYKYWHSWLSLIIVGFRQVVARLSEFIEVKQNHSFTRE